MDRNLSANEDGESPQVTQEKNPRDWNAKINKFQDAIGLDTMTLLKMLKGGLPPTIIVAMYQSTVISDITSTVGYLSAIMAVASQCLFPRAKFMKIMVYNLLSTCTAAALCCLAMFSVVKAREHTTSADGSLDDYNSSACAVSAVWLIFAIWISNTLRAYKQSELQDPMVAFAIFAGVTLTRAPLILSVANGLAFIKQLLFAFLFGFAIATGVSLLILPITNRRNFFMGAQKYAATIGAVLEAQSVYLGDLQTSGNQDRPMRGLGGSVNSADSNASHVKSTMISMVGIHDRLHGDLIYAMNEIAWGTLAAEDLQEIFSRLRLLFLPLAGLSLLPDIFQALDDDWRVSSEKVHRPHEVSHRKLVSQSLIDQLNIASSLVKVGCQHALLALEITPAKGSRRWVGSSHSAVSDVERTQDRTIPGSSGFASYLKEKANHFTARQEELQLTLAMSKAPVGGPNSKAQEDGFTDDEVFFVTLFGQYLLKSLVHATLNLVKFADSKAANGAMKQGRLIFPQDPFLKAWLALSDGMEKKSAADVSNNGSTPNESNGFVDPEHLAPVNLWERCGNVLRFISRVLSSNESTFGFRAAAASFSVAILAFLHQTQDFFTRQRLIWALIVIAFGMSPTSGAGLFSFAGRILATVVSLVLSLIVWYIVDGHVPGVIVFLYLANVFEYYFYIKYPRFLGPCVIGIVTLNVIVAYELQVKKIGIVVAESEGQPYYPIYLFGPYKLLTVIVGCTIALFWTIFPYPVTSRSQVRKLLGRGLFVLANFYSCMHTTIGVWIEGSQNELNPTPQSLSKTRKKLFSDEMTLITAMRMFSQFTVYEPPVGGKFPKSTYDNIISEIQSIVISMALMAKVPESLDVVFHQQEQKWLHHLASVIESTDFESHHITSLLCHLSAAVSTGTALPPYLSPPEPFPVARKLHQLHDGLLDRRNAQDPAFSAFATLEVLSSMVNRNLAQLISNVKSLVGEVKFGGYVKRQPRESTATRATATKID